MGTMTFGGQADEAASIRMVEYALDHGVNFFDTANAYNAGLSEEITGRALSGRRHRVVLATKVFNKMGDSPDQKGLSRAAIFRAIEESLKRLQTDYVDLYYLHQPDWTVPIEDSLQAMDDLVRQGKVRYPACSNYAAWQVTQMLWLAQSNAYKPVFLTQPMYNLLARAIEHEYLAMCRQFGVSTIVYNPLAGGLLTGKQQRGAPIQGSRFDSNRMYLDRYWNDDQFDAVEALRNAASAEGLSLVQFALSWLLQTPIDCVILGASRIDQLEENLAAFHAPKPLSSNSLAICDTIWDALRGVAPKYNR